MDSKAFLENIDTKLYGRKLFLFEELESTNKYAMSELENKIIDEGTSYIALRQTKGIGTSDSVWESEKQLGLWLSITLNSPIKKNPLSFVPGIACAKMLRECYNIDAHLKWPNDVLVGSKKLSGILVQAKSFSTNRVSYVVGIGINVFQNESDFSDVIREKATSLKIENPKIDYKLEYVYKNFMKYFEETYTNNKDNTIEEWVSLSKMIGSTIKMLRDEETLSAKVLSITKEGYLKVQYTDTNIVDTIEARTGININTTY